MVNLTSAPGNVTLIFFFKVDDVTRNVFLTMALLCFIFFFYFIAIMLKVFFTTPHMQENPRYILFVYMLINDTFYIMISNLIAITFMHTVYFPMIICLTIHTLSGTAFQVTPYNLALMSLERYIAVCFPLRHSQLCAPRRAKYAIVVIWLIGWSLCSANAITTMYFTNRDSYFRYMLCDGSGLMVSPVKKVIRTFTNIFTFTGVALIIVFTYINVMLVARKVSSGSSSALKAGKTVMLHAFQLMLCMASFISTVTEVYITNYTYFIIVLNYVLFTCVPRFLSPLIYGVRDEVFQKHIRKYSTLCCICCSH